MNQLFVVLLQFGVLGVLLDVFFLAGGLTNVKFYNDNSELSDKCEVSELVCRRLLVVSNTEIACAVSLGVVIESYLKRCVNANYCYTSIAN